MYSVPGCLCICDDGFISIGSCFISRGAFCVTSIGSCLTEVFGMRSWNFPPVSLPPPWGVLFNGDIVVPGSVLISEVNEAANESLLSVRDDADDVSRLMNVLGVNSDEGVGGNGKEDGINPSGGVGEPIPIVLYNNVIHV